MVGPRDEHDRAKEEELVGVGETALQEFQKCLAKEEGTTDEEEERL